MGLVWAIANINVKIKINVNGVGSALPSGWAGPGQARGGRREPVHGGLVAACTCALSCAHGKTGVGLLPNPSGVYARPMRLTPPQTYPGPALDMLSVTGAKSMVCRLISVAWAALGRSCRNRHKHRHCRWPVVRSFGLVPAASLRAGA